MNAIISVLLWISYFVSLYFAVFIFIQLLKNSYVFKKKRAHDFPLVTIVVPAFNEERTVIPTLESADKLDYPKEKLQVIAVDDGSTDNTVKLVQSFIRNKTHFSLILKANGGKASALNAGLRVAEGEFFACLDADSEVAPDALGNMLAEFSDNVAIVTPSMRVKKPRTFIQRIQRAEYLVQVLLARIISSIDCQYVAPGPFSIYRTSILHKLGGFDEKNMVEDQEIGYRHQLNHLRIKHCNDGYVFTNAPSSFGGFYQQRNRWYKGGLLCLWQYKQLLLNKKYGDFGVFQMLQNFVTYGLCIIALVVSFDILFLPWVDKLRNLFLVGFDVLPYLNTFTLNYDIISIGASQVIILAAMMAISLFIFWRAHEEMKESVFSHGFFVFIPYFFLYYLAKSAIVLIVLAQLAIGKRQKW